MNPAPNLVLVGPMGSGKSSIGKRLAERFRLAFLDADREIEARAGASIGTIFECVGETGFRSREHAVMAELLAADGAVIATGGGSVLDPRTRQLLRERGFVVHLHVSIAQQLARLVRDRSRPLLAGEDREDVLRRLADAPFYLQELWGLQRARDVPLDGARRTAARIRDVGFRIWKPRPAPSAAAKSRHN